MFQDKRPNHLNGHGRVVREFTAVSTKDEFVMCFQFSDRSEEHTSELQSP